MFLFCSLLKVVNYHTFLNKSIFSFFPHLPEVERWANYMIKNYLDADAEVILVAAWLHDIGHYPLPTDVDHAVRGEERAKAFLEKESYPEEKMKRVLHCVRAHRCRDVQPETVEAKIIACIDSASHMTEHMYFDMAKDDKMHKRDLRVYSKMERDFRDLAAFPEVQKKLSELHGAWKKLIEAFEKINLE